jgi:peptidoglycan hydrolase CwlO-like protein
MTRLKALIAAAVTTALIGLGVLTIGVNAASNPDSVPVSDSPVAAATVSTSAPSAQLQTQIDQMQNLINQYQDREKQYQAEISSMSQKLSDANVQVQQLQQVLVALQQRGVIQITRDGRIFVPGG